MTSDRYVSNPIGEVVNSHETKVAVPDVPVWTGSCDSRGR